MAPSNGRVRSGAARVRLLRGAVQRGFDLDVRTGMEDADYLAGFPEALRHFGTALRGHYWSECR